MMFSERIGIRPTTKMVQIESVDTDLRNTLWSLMDTFYWEKFDRSKYSDFGGRADRISGSNLNGLFISLWLNYLKEPTDTIPKYFFDSGGGLEFLRSFFIEGPWHQVYDFLELVTRYGPENIRDSFIRSCNQFLERENSGYRFVNGEIAEISSKEEVQAVEEAITNSLPFAGAKQHLEQALLHLKNREKPDYRNSIKESISAVESLCREIDEKKQATLSAALKALEKKGVLHPALKAAFSALYGYTSDSDGIRHALLEESKLTAADARFMLVSCSAFINYVISNVIGST